MKEIMAKQWQSSCINALWPLLLPWKNNLGASWEAYKWPCLMADKSDALPYVSVSDGASCPILMAELVLSRATGGATTPKTLRSRQSGVAFTLSAAVLLSSIGIGRYSLAPGVSIGNSNWWLSGA